jgi:hypothetical protein
MLKTIILLPLFALVSCTPASKKTDSQTKGNILTTQNPCVAPVAPANIPNITKKPINPQYYLSELKTLILLHHDIKGNGQHMEFVFNALTSKFVSFWTQSEGGNRKKINLIPFFQKCCTEELKASQYLSYGSCLDRTFNRVIDYENALNRDLLNLGKNLLLELSTKGRKEWCNYIDTVWSYYKE